jgi:hypothetical protein
MVPQIPNREEGEVATSAEEVAATTKEEEGDPVTWEV